MTRRKFLTKWILVAALLVTGIAVTVVTINRSSQDLPSQRLPLSSAQLPLSSAQRTARQVEVADIALRSQRAIRSSTESNERSKAAGELPFPSTPREAEVRWRTERRDKEWTDFATGYFSPFFNPTDGGPHVAHSVDCRETLCKIQIDFSRLAQLQGANDALKDDGYAFTYQMDQQAQHVDVYLARLKAQ
jgi:hypothetical protein